MVERNEEIDRLGGARADFVAHLGRRVADLAITLKSYRAEPASGRLRDELRRRVHALAAGARLLKFEPLSRELADCEELLERIAHGGDLEAVAADELANMFERMPALAWGMPVPEPLPKETDAPQLDESPLPASGPAARAVPPPPATLPGLGDFESARRPMPVAREPAPVTVRGVQPGNTAPPPPPVGRRDGETSGRTGVPQSALVVGPAGLADALSSAIDTGAGEHTFDAAFEVERTDDVATALYLARALAPDVVVIDTDVADARELCDTLLDDPLTEPVPIIALGSWTRPEAAAPFVALGVARALPKPVSPDVLRRACAEAVATYTRREFVREPLGELNLDQLGARLAEELRRGLCDAADAKGRTTRVELGEGSELLAAIWGAVARVRDLVTIHSKGAVRFSPTGPEGALPLAGWVGAHDSSPSAARALAPGNARLGGTARLLGMSVLVADDDPAVTWFLAGVLTTAGAEVHEAHDGARALDVAYRVAPDLVISDVVMPGLDGFALCRALKRDLVLRDVPVILLSWKEDLLQRVRELGADADGYMRKEASAAAIVQRVREVMRPRRRVAERLAAGGEVRGRLDGLTTCTLLGLACTHRPWSRLTVRDASFLYDVEIQEGRPARATRTATDGTFQRGPTVLAALLGVGSGRFVVTPTPAPDPATRRASRTDLEGRLSEQLYPAIAAARAAQRLLSGANLVQVERVGVAADRVAAYLSATPEPARSLVHALAAGASPRALITTGQASARLLEDVLCDAAAHGAITDIVARDGVDVFTPAVQRELAVLAGVRLSLPPAIPDPHIEVFASLEPAVLDAEAELQHELDAAAAPSEPASDAEVADSMPSELEASSAPEAFAASAAEISPAPEAVSGLAPEAVSAAAPEVADAPASEDLDASAFAEPPGAASIEEDEGLWPLRRSFVGLEPPPFAPVLTPSAAPPVTPTPTSGERLRPFGSSPMAFEPVARDAARAHARRLDALDATDADDANLWDDPTEESPPPSAISQTAPSAVAPALNGAAVVPEPQPEPEHAPLIEPTPRSAGIQPWESAPELKSETPAPEELPAAAAEPEPEPSAPAMAAELSSAPPVQTAAEPIDMGHTSIPTLAPIQMAPLATLGSLSPPPVAPDVLGSLAPPVAEPEPPRAPEPPKPAPKAAKRSVAEEVDESPSPPPRAHRAPRPSAYAPAAHQPPPAPDRRSTYLWIGFAVVACVFAVAMRWSRQQPAPQPAPPPAAAPQASADVAPAASATAAPAGTTQESSDESVSAQELPLRDEDKVGRGQGMLEVVAGASDNIYVDGKLVGPGPIRKLPLAPRSSPYEVRVKLRGEERVRFVSIKEGKLIRVRVAPPWSR